MLWKIGTAQHIRTVRPRSTALEFSEFAVRLIIDEKYSDDYIRAKRDECRYLLQHTRKNPFARKVTSFQIFFRIDDALCRRYAGHTSCSFPTSRTYDAPRVHSTCTKKHDTRQYLHASVTIKNGNIPNYSHASAPACRYESDDMS